MNGNSGYIYVMLNLAMEGKVMVGRVKDDPAMTLDGSQAPTDKDTQRILVYREFFAENIDLLEIELNNWLKDNDKDNSNGYFQVEPYQIIDKIQQLHTSFFPERKDGLVFPPNGGSDIPMDAFVLFDQACDYYYGRGSIGKDYREARRLLEEAHGLGVLAASIYLGRMFEYGEGVEPDVVKALQYYESAVAGGSNVGCAKIACLYWRDTVVKDLELGKQWWDRYFTSLDHHVITKDDYSNFNFYITLANENQLEIGYRDTLAIYKNQMIKLLEIRWDVCNEQHSGNIPFREYMLDIIQKEIAFVQSLEAKDLPGVSEDFAITSDFLNISNMGIILLANVERGEFAAGNTIKINAPGGISVDGKIKKIEKFGKFSEMASAGESVGFLVDGSQEELMFVKTGASIVTG
ncbi:SEL1-like repeat protein [Evansella tamaricis]|uniref:SEL1-like repeat protein n=1 Tax=Evansella tamaricis TaxID=2069301 RepID=A0ABS6JIQ6_9BACI|nr:SEL1-like repeat protein [Evansella tamaricis]MBU9712732.1 SEL1-like repeat protein [Evansella tamaricis]